MQEPESPSPVVPPSTQLMTRFFPISQPSITDKEIAYVTDAVRSGWVSSIGKYIEQFEAAFARYCGAEYALATSNGTTALHLALAALGVKTGDEVIIPNFSFVATANAVTYTGATVVPVDIEEDTYCISPAAVSSAITSRTRAIIPVHVYGHPADMDALTDLAARHRLLVIEDAAEAHGAECRGRRVGALGDCGIFSFYGNKIMTSGEGGMITSNNREFYLRARYLRDHAMSPERRYWHTEVGYNYRMTNLQAALGLAQLERVDSLVAKRRLVMAWYRAGLGEQAHIRLNIEAPWARSVYWMVCLSVEGMTDASREGFMAALRSAGVDSRPYFYPIADMPMYSDAQTPVTRRVSQSGVNLPSYFDLSEDDVLHICSVVLRVLREMGSS